MKRRFDEALQLEDVALDFHQWPASDFRQPPERPDNNPWSTTRFESEQQRIDVWQSYVREQFEVIREYSKRMTYSVDAALLRRFLVRLWNDETAIAVAGDEPHDHNCRQWVWSTLRRNEIIDRGDSSTVWVAADAPHVVVKILRPGAPFASFEREVRMTRLASDWGVAPKFIASGTCGPYRYIAMERYDMSLDRYVRHLQGADMKLKQKLDLVQKVKAEVVRLKNVWIERGYVHMDLHMGNVVVRHDHVRIIDFGSLVLATDHAVVSQMRRRGQMEPDAVDALDDRVRDIKMQIVELAKRLALSMTLPIS